MTRMTIDPAGTVCLWDDTGTLVDQVVIDPATGRSERVHLSSCPHLVVSLAGVCLSCCVQVILPQPIPTPAPEPVPAAADEDAEIRGGMVAATLIMLVCTLAGIGLSWLLLWLRWS